MPGAAPPFQPARRTLHSNPLVKLQTRPILALTGSALLVGNGVWRMFIAPFAQSQDFAPDTARNG
jgi:hypothetical protein